MKNKKILFSIITLIILVIIILIIVLIVRNNFLKDHIIDGEGNVLEVEESLGDTDKDAMVEKDRLKNEVYFFSIEQYINQYLDAISVKSGAEVLNYLNVDYISENNLTIDNVLSNIEESYKFIATEIYETRDKTLYSYIVKGVKDDNIFNDEKYYIFDLDLLNNTFSITPLYQYNYTDINQIQPKEELKEIKSNNHNGFSFQRFTTDSIFKRYARVYINLLKNNLPKAYEMLDEEYKKLRFSNNYNNFVNYITQMNNNNKIDTEITEITKYNTNNEYLIKTQNDNRYIIKAEIPMDFTVQLDEYTIITDSFKQTYESASDIKKVSTNVDKIMKMINNYDYENLYNLLDETYKQTNFNNKNNFINYIQQHFYNSNIYEIQEIITEDEKFTVEVKVYKESSIDSEYNFNNIIIILEKDTNFKFYFK